MKNPFHPCASAILCAIAFLFTPAADTSAQFDNMGLKTKWRSGSIVRNDGTTRKGLIQFNDKLGVILFKQNPEDPEESFAETSISVLEFFDDNADRLRRFATFNLKEEETGRQLARLFEIVMEFRDFALLSRIETANMALRERQVGVVDPTSPTRRTTTVKVGYEQFERFYLVNEAGILAEVLVVSELEKDKLEIFARRTKPDLDKKTIKSYLKDDYDRFNTLVKENNLNLKKKADFILAFEYLRGRESVVDRQ